MKILIIDCVCENYAHLRFNATVIEGICSALSLTGIGFCGEKQHIAQVSAMLDDKIGKHFEMYPIGTRHQKITSKSKIKSAFEFLHRYWKAFQIIRREKPDRILFLGVENTIWPLFASTFLSKHTFRHKVDLYIVLHNLHRIKISRIKRILWKIMFNRLDLHSIVLADTVQDKFAELFPNRSSFLWRHPSYEHLIPGTIDKDINSESFSPNGVIRFLLAGRQGALAISSGFLELLASSCNRITKATGKKFEIIVSATFPTGEEPLFGSNVKLLNQRLSDQEYFQAIADSDYVAFPLESDVDYRASGILADAITMQTPVLAPNRGHFREIYSTNGLMMGGWLYNDTDDLEGILLGMAKMLPVEYNNMCQHIVVLKREISLQNAGMRLRSIFDRVG